MSRVPRISTFAVRQDVDSRSESEEEVSEEETTEGEEEEEIVKEPVTLVKYIGEILEQYKIPNTDNKTAKPIAASLGRAFAVKFGRKPNDFDYSIMVEVGQLLHRVLEVYLTKIREVGKDATARKEAFLVVFSTIKTEAEAISKSPFDSVWSLPSLGWREAVKKRQLEAEFNFNAGVEMPDKKCHRCKRSRFTEHETQLRGNDEASTRILKCARCGAEYSRTD